jgi:hypothetical protein
MQLADSRAAQLNLDRDSNIPGLNPTANPLDEVSGKFLIAGEQAQALRKAAKVTRGKAQPAARGPIISLEAIESKGIEHGQPMSGCGNHLPG